MAPSPASLTNLARRGSELWHAPLPPSFASFVGRKLLRFLFTVQGLGAFALITLGVMIRKFGTAPRVIHPLVRAQLARSGVSLLPMTLFLSAAVGLIIIGQTVWLLARLGYGASDVLGPVMVMAVVRELGPLLAALLVLSRTGTANVIELGTARALGQVEALETLGIDPIHYLVVPRVIGMALGIFSLTVFFILGALGSGWLWAFLQDVPMQAGDYFGQLAASLRVLDFITLALKTLGFGTIIAVVTCYHGLAQPLRLEDVSAATVRAMAQSVILCLLLDALFLGLYLVA